MFNSARYMRLSLPVLPVIAILVAGAGCGGAVDLPGCGDGVLNAGEDCDGTQFEPAAPAGHGECRNDCTYCGNGIVDGETGVEQCDDGNEFPTDGCTNACTLPACGDGILDTSEGCDGPQFEPTAPAGHGECRSDCTYCGNGTVDGPTGDEQCDDGNGVDTDDCTNACQNAVCGDGVVHAGVEQCDGGSIGSDEGCSSTCQIEALLVVDDGTPPFGAVLGFRNPSGKNGPTTPKTVLESSGITKVRSPSEIVVTGDGSLIVGNNLPNSLTRYPIAVTADGSIIEPNATVTGIPTGFSLAIDRARDILYVADPTSPGMILVYDNVSDPSFNGATPARTFTSSTAMAPVSIHHSDFGGTDDLFIADSNGSGRVQVFASASTETGLGVPPKAVIPNPSFGTVDGVFVDVGDTLFVLDNALPGVHVIVNASEITTLVAVPAIILRVSPSATFSDLVVDSAGTLYLADSGNAVIKQFDDVLSPTLGTSISHARQIEDDGSSTLVSPVGLFLLDP